MDEAEKQQTQLEQMTTEQMMVRVKENQHQIKVFLDQLIIRASVQEYTEQ